MVSFINEFISYLLLVVIMVAVAICGGFIGKKLRDMKSAKAAEENEKNTEVE